MELLNLKNIDLEGKRVFIRCDFNVPLDEFGNITDDRRIRSALATIEYCLDNNASVVLASHLGRPKGKFDPKYSLKPIQKRLHSLLHLDVQLAKDVVGEDAKKKVANLKIGEVLLLENLRFEEGETKNDPEFSKALANFGDIYVNDAFGVSHRNHSSVSGITEYFDNQHKAAGFLLQKEIQFFSKLLNSPARPFTAIVGGSKVSGKLEALKNLLPKVDKLIIGGGMAFTFLKALGENIGKSIVEDHLIPEALNIMEEARKLGVKIYLPVDVVASDGFSENANIKLVTVKDIPDNWMGLDIGPASVKLFQLAIRDSQTILWNGPMGVYEMEKFSRGSFKLAHTVAETFATTIIGGGDTADLIKRTNLDEDMTFISTGGGASLELIEGKVLPGVLPLIKE
ncbi:MAG TPA: phosphoglycerate kinase [Campylobacterales bacterium]|nr:phosphoglycerate kinase [Campylobacterales bacterium]HIO70608.1 phosphoglycerate kinase [Campylobacterales bacterium]